MYSCRFGASQITLNVVSTCGLSRRTPSWQTWNCVRSCRLISFVFLNSGRLRINSGWPSFRMQPDANNVIATASDNDCRLLRNIAVSKPAEILMLHALRQVCDVTGFMASYWRCSILTCNDDKFVIHAINYACINAMVSNIVVSLLHLLFRFSLRYILWQDI